MAYQKKMTETSVELIRPIIERLDRLPEGDSIRVTVGEHCPTIKSYLYTYFHLHRIKGKFKIIQEGEGSIRIRRISQVLYTIDSGKDPIEEFVVENLLGATDVSEVRASLLASTKFLPAEIEQGVAIWAEIMGEGEEEGKKP
jgi:hypothetical protein